MIAFFGVSSEKVLRKVKGKRFGVLQNIIIIINYFFHPLIDSR